METLSLILGLLAGVSYMVGLQLKKRWQFLISAIIANLLFATSFLVIEAYSGAVLSFVLTVQTIINYFFRGKKLPIWLLAIYLVTNIGLGILFFTNYMDIFSILASVWFIALISVSKERHTRLLGIGYGLIWLTYAVVVLAWGVIISNILICASGIIAFITKDLLPYYKNKKAGKNNSRQ